MTVLKNMIWWSFVILTCAKTRGGAGTLDEITLSVTEYDTCYIPHHFLKQKFQFCLLVLFDIFYRLFNYFQVTDSYHSTRD